MIKSGTKKMVVLRDIPSNIIEEAILILRKDSLIDEKNLSYKSNIDKKRDFLILKEAEMIINSFNKDNANAAQNIKQKNDSAKKVWMNLAINTCLVGALGVLIFLIMQLF